MEIDLFDETNKITIEQKEMVQAILDFSGDYIHLEKETELSILFVDNEKIQEINREFRSKDQPTDVISFALEDEVENDFILNLADFEGVVPRNIGDIVISVDKAIEQANEYGHSLNRELGFLALHGFLHLNGYNHMEPVEEKEMFGLQKEILDAYGLER
ncbi:probable rRNA maturation factor [Carnobacterium iners]|uniref:Endoribonuclease YbeY n=1 Tax=Carnobacterium iners TaxID=1073423 RepID=A0A1X7NHK1_9LACT|nr:rRNA maturation RNase YbeY [Carnobacterium iners]SEK40134.1 probable rRNA maturation factor [Carnobacterium iners]SMH36569.1 probable rRNA maturation factor [Carnobacterium iners]